MKDKVSRFFQALVEAFPIITASPDTLTIPALKQWADIIINIEQIGDTNAIQYLAPFLRNKTKISVPSRSIMTPTGYIMIKRIRVCDYALEAIYKLRGIEREYEIIYFQYVKRNKSFFENEQAMNNFYEIIQPKRDNLISELIKQLKREQKRGIGKRKVSSNGKQE